MIEKQPVKYNATLATITKYLKDDHEVPVEGLKATIDQVYTIVEEMIEANVKLIKRYHNLSPVEFVFLTYMIAKLPELSITQYQNHLLAVKEHVWAKHDDVRFNCKVLSTLKNFVDNIKNESTSNYQTSLHTSNTFSASSSTRRIGKGKPLINIDEKILFDLFSYCIVLFAMLLVTYVTKIISHNLINYSSKEI
jgi:hypothetical protein